MDVKRSLENEGEKLETSRGDDKAELTALLRSWGEGDDAAGEQLFPRIYGELRKLAAALLRGQRADHTLQPTALVNEAYCRLVDQRAWGWQSRRHFYAIAAKMMRRILVDHARRHAAEKRGADFITVALDDTLEAMGTERPDLVALDDALKSLEQLDPKKTLIVDLRFFVGLDLQEIAEVTQLSTATVTRQWLAAKAWLYRELAAEGVS